VRIDRPKRTVPSPVDAFLEDRGDKKVPQHHLTCLCSNVHTIPSRGPTSGGASLYGTEHNDIVLWRRLLAFQRHVTEVASVLIG